MGNSHPWDLTNWLFYRGGLLIQFIQLFLYVHDIVYVYVRDSSSSNTGTLLHVIAKLYPVTQRQCVILHLLFSHFPFARGCKPQEMTSQVIGKSACYEWPSYIIGYHEYISV